MRMLAIDPGLTNIGWAVFEDKELIATDSSTVANSREVGLRLCGVREQLWRILDIADWENVRIVAVEVEDNISAFPSKARSGKSVAHYFMAAGVVLQEIYRVFAERAEVITVRPAEWTKGRRKERRKKELELVYRWRFRTQHIADAVGIGHWALSRRLYASKR